VSASSRTTLNRTSTVLESGTVKYSDSFGTACRNHCFTPEYLGFPAIASAKGVSFDRLGRSVFFGRVRVKKTYFNYSPVIEIHDRSGPCRWTEKIEWSVYTQIFQYECGLLLCS
jgi:hypothetical protein